MVRRKRRKPAESVAVWSRVSEHDLAMVERRNPPWGWRSMVMREACRRLAQRLKQGDSMDVVAQVGAETGDWFVDATNLDKWDRTD